MTAPLEMVALAASRIDLMINIYFLRALIWEKGP